MEWIKMSSVFQELKSNPSKVCMWFGFPKLFTGLTVNLPLLLQFLCSMVDQEEITAEAEALFASLLCDFGQVIASVNLFGLL